MVGAHPAMEVVAKENKVTILDHEKGCVTEKVVDDPMAIPRSISESWRPQLVDDLPDAFCGNIRMLNYYSLLTGPHLHCLDFHCFSYGNKYEVV